MPRSAPLPCRHPGCAALVEDGRGYCPRHRNDLRQWDNTARAKARQSRRAWHTGDPRLRELEFHPVLFFRRRNEDRLNESFHGLQLFAVLYQ